MSESAIRTFAANLGFLITLDGGPIERYQEASMGNGICGCNCKGAKQ